MFKKILCISLVALCLITSVFAATPPSIQAKGAILANGDTGEVLFEQNADARLYPASTTKIMTAILALENGDPNSIVTVNQSALEGLTEMGSTIYLIPGEEIAFMDLLRYILIASGNDACSVMAEHIAGSVPAFVDMMNAKAEELGCTNTHFANPHGLHDENHYTSARDLLLISMYAMKNETFAQIVSETSVTLPVTNKHSETTLRYSTNHLLSKQSNSRYYTPSAIGIKTGSTTPAGLCLCAAFRYDHATFYTVVLGSPRGEDGVMGNFEDTLQLLKYAENNFSVQTLLQADEPVCQVNLRLAKDKEKTVLAPVSDVTALLPNDFDAEQVQLDYTTEEDITAPLTKGEKLGTVTVEYQGKTYGSVDLVATEDVERSQVLYVLDCITNFFGSLVFKIVFGVILLLIVLFVVFVTIRNRRRRKRRSRYAGRRYRR